MLVFPLLVRLLGCVTPFRKKDGRKQNKITAVWCGVTRHAASSGGVTFFEERVLVVNLEKLTIRFLQGGQLWGWTPLENVLPN